MFDRVPAYPGDPILGLNEDFKRDPRAGKVNLGIGIYFDEAGRIPLLRSVREAEATLVAEESPRPYLPMAGLPDYRTAVQAFVFGRDHPALKEARIATLQTVAGSGALKVGADFLKRYFPGSGMWISDPSWENHRVVFEAAGFDVHTYPYYDPASGGVRFEHMQETLRQLPRESIVLLHACCHNPTGADLDRAQWDALAPILLERGLIAFVDMAYQGLGEDPDADAYGPRKLAREGVTCLVANSFSKIFSLYGERCGGLSVTCAHPEEAERVLGQVMGSIRANYSNPPTHGARIVSQVLNTAPMRERWMRELEAMRERMASMRRALHAALATRLGDATPGRYLTQRGMFTYTGLDTGQVHRLRERHAIYLLDSGRMCMAGLNAGNVAGVADAIAAVMTETPTATAR